MSMEEDNVVVLLEVDQGQGQGQGTKTRSKSNGRAQYASLQVPFLALEEKRESSPSGTSSDPDPNPNQEEDPVEREMRNLHAEPESQEKGDPDPLDLAMKKLFSPFEKEATPSHPPANQDKEETQGAAPEPEPELTREREQDLSLDLDPDVLAVTEFLVTSTSTAAETSVKDTVTVNPEEAQQAPAATHGDVGLDLEEMEAESVPVQTRRSRGRTTRRSSIQTIKKEPLPEPEKDKSFHMSLRGAKPKKSYRDPSPLRLSPLSPPPSKPAATATSPSKKPAPLQSRSRPGRKSSKASLSPPLSPAPSLAPPSPTPEVVTLKKAKKRLVEKKKKVKEGFCWRDFLTTNISQDICPVPIENFDHAPLSMIWDLIAFPNLKVEVIVAENYEIGGVKYDKAFWFGSVIKYFGYLVQVVEEGYPLRCLNVPHQWINFLNDCFPYGHAATLQNTVVIPPQDFPPESGYTADCWKDRMKKMLEGQLTFHSCVATEFKKTGFGHCAFGDSVEVVDPSTPGGMIAGTVKKVNGTRLFVEYWKHDGKTLGCWLDTRSEHLQPPGWSRALGLEISAPEDYKPLPPEDDYFEAILEQDYTTVQIEEGMKLEAVDPLDSSRTIAATVAKVLPHGYMMLARDADPIKDVEEILNIIDVETDAPPDEPFSWVAHYSSLNIFPCGFSKALGIEMLSPSDCPTDDFDWDVYFESCGLKALKLPEKQLEKCREGFAIGRKLEAVDLTKPSLIRVATIHDIRGRLLRIRFDGIEKDQWMDYRSPDIYPIGWCDTFDHKLIGPKEDSPFWRKYTDPRKQDPPTDGGFQRFPCIAPKTPANTKRPVKRKQKP